MKCIKLVSLNKKNQTDSGTFSFIVYEDHDKPTFITYPNLALNCEGEKNTRRAGGPMFRI